MKYRTLATLTLALLSGALACSPVKTPRQPRTGEPTLTVLSYNLNYGMAGDLATLDALQTKDADLILLQETTPEWEAVITARLSERYPHMRFRHCCGAGGLAVLSKRPFEERDYKKASAAWFPAWRLLAETPIGPLEIMNVHLRPQVSDSGSVVSGYFTTPSVRQREMEEYSAWLERDRPTLVAGDFNENDGGRAVSILERQGFRSAVVEFHPGAQTWRWQTSLGQVHAQLDHIMYDAQLEPLDAEVIARGNSDHFPVVARFRRAPAPALASKNQFGDCWCQHNVCPTTRKPCSSAHSTKASARVKSKRSGAGCMGSGFMQFSGVMLPK